MVEENNISIVRCDKPIIYNNESESQELLHTTCIFICRAIIIINHQYHCSNLMAMYDRQKNKYKQIHLVLTFILYKLGTSVPP